LAAPPRLNLNSVKLRRCKPGLTRLNPAIHSPLPACGERPDHPVGLRRSGEWRCRL
jgi:hypothetical protein